MNDMVLALLTMAFCILGGVAWILWAPVLYRWIVFAVMFAVLYMFLRDFDEAMRRHGRRWGDE